MSLDIKKQIHTAIVMDWSRRQAIKKKESILSWHKAWFEKSIEIIEHLVKSKVVSCLTLWALSIENLKERNPIELSWIMKLINKLQDLLPSLQKNNIKFDTIWDIAKLPSLESQSILDDIKIKTSNNTWMNLVVALAYSWQDEIVRAVKKIINAWLDPDELDEKTFRNYLDTAKFPNPDLIIRTWIHEWTECKRHSGFMLYDSAYAEYYFTDTLWPDFTKEEFDKAILEFHKTKRTKWK